MENTFRNAIKYINQLNEIDIDWNKDKKTIASAMMSYAGKVKDNNCYAIGMDEEDRHSFLTETIVMSNTEL